MPNTPVEGTGRVGTLVREIQRQLLPASTREAIETTVCNEVVAVEPHVGAWIGSQDPDTHEVDVRAAAGIDASDVHRLSGLANDEQEPDGGPAAAMITRSPQVDVRTDGSGPVGGSGGAGSTGGGNGAASTGGGGGTSGSSGTGGIGGGGGSGGAGGSGSVDAVVRARAAIPLAADDQSYGVMTVYADRPSAFDGGRQHLLEELGESVARAIADAEARERLAARKRKYERLTERIADAYYAVDEEWRITYWNEEMGGRTGVSAEEANGEVLWDIVPALRDTTLESVYREAMATQEHHAVEHHFEEPEDVWVAVDVYPDADGLSIFSRDITARKQYERRLREQRDDLEVLNQVVRHDIRNDLQLISAYAELLGDRLEEPDREYVETIARRARSAVELTQSARSLAAVMLQAEPETEPMPLASTLETQVAETRSTYPEAEIAIADEVPDVSVVGNELLSSVFRNLLKNAVQHNDEPEPTVEVSVATDADTVTVSVADNGPGVPDHRKEDIFGKGEKGLESGGTGVGLYLVRTLAESYGGSVAVSDNDPVGAVFSVTLPRAD